MVKPGAVVVDVGINRVSDAADPKGYRMAATSTTGRSQRSGLGHHAGARRRRER